MTFTDAQLENLRGSLELDPGMSIGRDLALALVVEVEAARAKTLGVGDCGVNWCWEQSAGNYICTREAGHDGPHDASGVFQWTNDADAISGRVSDTPPVPDQEQREAAAAGTPVRCGAERDGLRCILFSGHPENHTAPEPGSQHDFLFWSKDPDNPWPRPLSDEDRRLIREQEQGGGSDE